MTTLAHLRALHAAIGSALDEIDRVYGARGLDFPSPDAPICPNSEAEKLTTEPAIAKATGAIVYACGQLSKVVHPPFYTVMENAQAGHISAALQFLEASHIVEILASAAPHALHVSEIAPRIDYIRAGPDNTPLSHPLQPKHLSHILRLLAAHQWIREVRPDVFAINRLSSLLDSGKTPEQLREDPACKYDGANGALAMVPMCTGAVFRTMSYLSEYLLNPIRDPRWAACFNYAYQTEEQIYIWYERPENSIRHKQTIRAMTAGTSGEGRDGIADSSAFPWLSLAPGTVVADVGGGVGGISVCLARAHPHLKFVVQDRAQTLAAAPAAWGTRHQEIFASGRVTYQPQDFFDPQPEGLKVGVFLLARIMHNWPDDACQRILRRLREAATPETRLLIVEQIIPPTTEVLGEETEATSAKVVPNGVSKVFPNGVWNGITNGVWNSIANGVTNGITNGKHGKAGVNGDQSKDSKVPVRRFPYSSLTMMAMMDGEERTLREFETIAAAAGWRIDRVARAEGSSFGALFGYMTCVPI
ncbi:S-adenosyl-L-methionine-dependent methyltransferase [Daedaleopsis nitida]|nr:S-adenosyl-L-methionine-dependent methyltransferase [Daedaleopsis nitida]